MVRLNPRSLRVLNQDGAPNAIHSVEGVDHVGAFLREARENTGRTVADVAQVLRIRRVYLEAIEDGRFDELPGAAYAVGFIRSYATFLRLDVPAIVARFKEEASGIEAQQDLDFPTPVPEGRFPGGMVVTLCLVVAAAGLGGWYWWQSQNTIEVARVPPPPEVLTGSTDRPVESDVAGEPSVVETTQVTPPIALETPSEMVNTSTAVVEDTQSVPEPVVAPEPAAITEVMKPTELVVPTDVEMAETPPVEPVISQTMASAAQEVPAVAQAPDSISSAPPVSVAAVTSEEPVVTPAAEAVVAPEPEIVAPETVAPEAIVEAIPDPTPPVQTAVVVPSTPPAPNSDLNVGVALPPEPDSGSTQAASLPTIPGAPAASEAASDGRTYGIVNRDARIILSARDPDTWVQVMDSQQNALLTQMLRPGDRYLVPNRPGLSLQTNNAGGLEILVDGTSVPAIGGRGDIRRDVRLDPESLKSGTAVIQ